ncbi:MAG: hypothetical protein ABSB78_08910 [Bacteroidota bacterium]
MNITTSAFIASWLAAFCMTSAQSIPVNFTINTSKDTLRISPYIYGTNGRSDDNDLNITARRPVGDRLTGYNRENNLLPHLPRRIHSTAIFCRQSLFSNRISRIRLIQPRQSDI